MPYKDKAKQLAYQRQWQEKHVALGLCRTCRQPRKRSKYKTLCTRCGKAHAAANKRWGTSDKAKAAKRAWRHAMAEQGLCTNCGKAPAMKRHRYCRRCRDKNNSADSERRRDARTWWSARPKRDTWWER